MSFAERKIRPAASTRSPSVNDPQAEIVRRIFREYLNGAGLKRIAVRLNDDHIAPSHAGRRGTGSWCPGAIREMLRNGRYRGVYTTARPYACVVARKVSRSEHRRRTSSRSTFPRWRIIDDTTWYAVQDLAMGRAAESTFALKAAPRTRYALSALARCAHSAAQSTRRTSACRMVVTRRSTAARGITCAATRSVPSSCGQSIEEVDGAVAEHILRHWVTPSLVAEILAELARRSQRIRTLEIDLAAARRTPAMV
jgi:hypothetical protein